MTYDLESIYERFESAWTRGITPDLQEFLPAVDDPCRRDAMLELIRLDLEFRWRNAVADSAATTIRPRRLLDYRDEFPELTTEELIDSGLIFEEYRVRMRWGDAPSEADFARDFDVPLERILPQLKDVASELVDEETVTRGSARDEDTLTKDERPHDNRLTSIEIEVTGEPAAEGRFGNYDLLSEIARGGMGVVYKARQRKLNRIVALKMITSGQLASNDEVRRFYVEAEAAARLDHPAIVPVYDVGQHEDQHFFTMGFVDGESLQDRLRPGPLAPREAAGLSRQIAEGIEYAHRHGIVHRDLKPANVLIDQDGQPRITDFGLAKNTEIDSGLTATGQVMGTPSYMPPEQAAGRLNEIGPASDVYSLGAVLYALLTGRPPFQAANVMETLKQVCEQEPVSPRVINAAVDKDLETICLKSLEKERANRYASAGEFAADVARYLEDKPIVARPIGRPARLWRWCKRNPLGATVVVLMVFLAIAGPAIAVYQIEINRQLDEALAGETEQREKAEAKEQEARESERKMGIALKGEKAALARKEKALRETQAAIDHYVQTVKNAKLLRDPRFKDLLKLLLKDALAHYRRFVEEHKDDQDQKTRFRMALAFHEIGYISAEKGSKDEAIKAYRQAVRLYERLVRDDPAAAEYQKYLAASYKNLGILYRATGKSGEALAAYRQALEIRERLARRHPKVFRYQKHLAVTHHNFGNLYAATGKPAKALGAYRQALEIHERLASDNPTVTEFQHDLARSYFNLSYFYSTNGKPAKALAAQRQALTIRERLVRDNSTSTQYRDELADSQRAIGVLYSTAGLKDRALAAYRQALRTRERLARDNPTVTEYQRDLALTHNNVGVLYGAIGKPAEALETYRRGLKICEHLAQDNPTVTEYWNILAGTHSNIGKLYRATGKPTDALASYQQALKIRERLARDNPTVTAYRKYLADSYNNLGNLYDATGKPPEALVAYRQSLKIHEQMVCDNPTVAEFQKNVARCQTNIGSHYRANGKPADALSAYLKALKIQARLTRDHPAVTEFHSNLATTYNNLGILHRSSGKSTDALTAYRQALKIRERLVRDNPTITEYQKSLAVSLNNLGNLYLMTGKPADASAAFARAITTLQRILKRNPRAATAKRYLRSCHSSLAMVLNQLGRHAEAARNWLAALKLDSGRYRFYHARQYTLALARSGKYAHATRNAAALAEKTRASASLYDLARVYGISTAAAERDTNLAASDRDRVTSRYAAAAMSLLRRAAKAGYFKTAAKRRVLATNRDFDALRQSDDFRQFAKTIGVKLPVWAPRPNSAK